MFQKENATLHICKHHLVHTDMYFLLNAYSLSVAFSIMVPIRYRYVEMQAIYGCSYN